MIKTRFAPSPTGYLHIGGLKTALFSYLFAKQNNGNFVLRIEDTDQGRYVADALDFIKDGLRWGGLQWDEGPEVGGDCGPYIQSERKEIYQQYIKELVNKGFAYYCFCTSERLEKMREEQTKNNMPPKYDRCCLDLSKEEVEQRIANGERYVIRMKVPDNQIIRFKDAIKGDIEFNTKEVDDQVLMKSDGLPTYHFAVVIDDHLMGITHIVRADEWVSSTPKQILLYNAFGWDVPVFAHVPPILAPGGKKKLSKREGSVGVHEFIAQGFLPEGMINYLALLGWNPGTTEEIFTLDELVKRFDLNKCQKAGAVFDPLRLEWVNGQHIRRMDVFKFREKIYEFIEKTTLNSIKESNSLELKDSLKNEKLKTKKEDLDFKKFAIIEQERINKLSEYEQDFNIIYNFNEDYDGKLILNDKMGADKDSAILALEEAKKIVENIDFNNINSEIETIESNKLMELKKIQEEKIKNLFLDKVKELNKKNGQILWPIRYALTGVDKSPTIFELIWAIGIEESARRLNIGLEKLKNM